MALSIRHLTFPIKVLIKLSLFKSPTDLGQHPIPWVISKAESEALDQRQSS